MKTWLILAAVAVSFAVPTDAEAHWPLRYRRSFYGIGYPAYTSYYAAPVYVARRPVVAYYPPPVVAAPVVSYRPVTYGAYYGPTYGTYGYYGSGYGYYGVGYGYGGYGGYGCGW